MLNDLRFAFRTSTNRPASPLIAILTLAIGIGATTAMFSTLRALVLDPVSLPEPDRIVHVWSGDGWPLSIPDFIDLREQATTFESFGAYSPGSVNLGGEHPEVIRSIAATPGVLESLGVLPVQADRSPSWTASRAVPQVAVISHALWHRACNADPAIVGKTIRSQFTRHHGHRRDAGRLRTHLSLDADHPAPDLATASIWTLKPGRGSHWLLGVAR